MVKSVLLPIDSIIEVVKVSARAVAPIRLATTREPFIVIREKAVERVGRRQEDLVDVRYHEGIPGCLYIPREHKTWGTYWGRRQESNELSSSRTDSRRSCEDMTRIVRASSH
jgi:hypothetical protein